MFFLTLTLALYFVPALLASSRHHPRAEAIWWVNALTGWTLAGWVVCLVWALSEQRRFGQPQLYTPRTIPGQYAPAAYPAGWSAASGAVPDQLCRVCGRPVLSAASFCTMCGAMLR